MNNKLLTVVVPAYNAERYLSANLNSLLAAGAFAGASLAPEALSFARRALEILVVDDGSTDRTAEIADSFQARYPETVRVIHKENGGHGSGINAGIRHASGRYFKVVDADDWVEPGAFVRLLEYLEGAESDLVGSGFYWRLENGEADCRSYPRRAEMEEPFRGVEYGREYAFDEVAGELYLKMHHFTVRTEILREQGVVIDTHCFYVDTEFVLYPIPGIRTVSFLPDVVYQYRVGRAGQSVTPEKLRANESQYVRVLEQLLLFYRRSFEEGKLTEAKRRYCASFIARVAAGRVRILLSRPLSFGAWKELRDFHRGLRREAPDVYRANRNRAVRALRAAGGVLYLPAALLLRLRRPVYER